MGGVALLVIGNSPATLLPFIVGTLEDGFNLDKQKTGSIVSTELIAMSLSAIFFWFLGKQNKSSHICNAWFRHSSNRLLHLLSNQ